VTTAIRRSPVLVVGVVTGLVIGAAELIGGGTAWRAAISTAIPIAYALLVTVLARRSETVSVLAGRPVDERWELMNQEAAAWALGLSAIVILGAFVVADAEDAQLLTLDVELARAAGRRAVRLAGARLSRLSEVPESYDRVAIDWARFGPYLARLRAEARDAAAR